MDRKEEINKEIDLLEKRIISLKNERYDIIKKENPIYVGDCFVQFRRVDNVYYKIVQVSPEYSRYKVLVVSDNEISTRYWSILENSEADFCSSEEFDTIYNKVISGSLANKVIY